MIHIAHTFVTNILKSNLRDPYQNVSVNHMITFKKKKYFPIYSYKTINPMSLSQPYIISLLFMNNLVRHVSCKPSEQ